MPCLIPTCVKHVEVLDSLIPNQVLLRRGAGGSPNRGPPPLAGGAQFTSTPEGSPSPSEYMRPRSVH